MKPKSIYIAAAIAVVFGVMTLISGSSTLFIDGAAREAAGNYVGFVLWFNFIAGFAYVIAGIGLAFSWTWAVNLSIFIAASTIIVFLALIAHIVFGGAWEIRTLAAMILRSAVWVVIAWAVRKKWKGHSAS